MGFFKSLFNKNENKIDIVGDNQATEEPADLPVLEPEPTPEPTVYLQKFIKGSWVNVERENSAGKYRTVTVEHDGVTTVGYKSRD